MKIRAFQEHRLSKAQSVLGDAFDYAINDCSIPGNEFVMMFVASDTGKRIENGDPACISGKSGIEIAIDVIEETKKIRIDIEPKEKFFRTKEYWVGWAVCYYQWYTCRKYAEIFDAVNYQEFEKMYNTLHEADITKFVEVVNSKIKDFYPETNLKRYRVLCGYSQSKLAELSGVGLRSIQMYEQRNKDINKANAETLYSISKIIGCSVEDLIEK